MKEAAARPKDAAHLHVLAELKRTIEDVGTDFAGMIEPT